MGHNMKIVLLFMVMLLSIGISRGNESMLLDGSPSDQKIMQIINVAVKSNKQLENARIRLGISDLLDRSEKIAALPQIGIGVWSIKVEHPRGDESFHHRTGTSGSSVTKKPVIHTIWVVPFLDEKFITQNIRQWQFRCRARYSDPDSRSFCDDDRIRSWW